MSYILEALKKAQAERQLGNAPTIHAPAPSYAAPAAPRAGSRRTLALGLGAGALVALAALFWWRQAGEQAAPAAAPAASAASAASTASPASTAVVPAIPVAPAASDPAPATAVASAPAPVDAAPPRRQPQTVAASPAPVPDKPARGVVAPIAVPAPPAPPVRSAPPRAADAGAPAGAATAPAEETIRTLQQLPEAIQREIPKVSFGGYIYSPDPAESLLLVDKTLRRAGEEVAPGLVLERLLPQAAVMNYRGYRYRVAY